MSTFSNSQFITFITDLIKFCISYPLPTALFEHDGKITRPREKYHFAIKANMYHIVR